MSKKVVYSSLGALLFALSFPVEARQPGKVYRVGYLTARWAENEKHWIAAFQEKLGELGYTEGKNLVVELRRVPGDQRQNLRELPAELVRLKVDVIVASGGDPARVAREVSATIPIVFTVSADPVGAGLVQSLARPGGNVTGLSDLHSVLVTKRLELLKEVVPAATRVAVLWNPTASIHPPQLKDIQAAAPAFGVTILALPATGSQDIDRAFATMKTDRPGALLVLGGGGTGNLRRQIVDHAARNRLPTIFTTRENVDAGGLMSYGTNFTEIWRRAAVYVDKILKGAKPAELPIEQPTKFELVINLKTAKQIGLTIPETVLYRADKVIK